MPVKYEALHGGSDETQCSYVLNIFTLYAWKISLRRYSQERLPWSCSSAFKSVETNKKYNKVQKFLFRDLEKITEFQKEALGTLHIFDISNQESVIGFQSLRFSDFKKCLLFLGGFISTSMEMESPAIAPTHVDRDYQYLFIVGSFG